MCLHWAEYLGQRLQHNAPIRTGFKISSRFSRRVLSDQGEGDWDGCSEEALQRAAAEEAARR